MKLWVGRKRVANGVRRKVAILVREWLRLVDIIVSHGENMNMNRVYDAYR